MQTGSAALTLNVNNYMYNLWLECIEWSVKTTLHLNDCKSIFPTPSQNIVYFLNISHRVFSL